MHTSVCNRKVKKIVLCEQIGIVWGEVTYCWGPRRRQLRSDVSRRGDLMAVDSEYRLECLERQAF